MSGQYSNAAALDTSCMAGHHDRMSAEINKMRKRCCSAPGKHQCCQASETALQAGTLLTRNTWPARICTRDLQQQAGLL